MSIDNQTTHRRRWLEVAEEMANNMVPPAVMVGSTLMHFITVSLGLKVILLLVCILWLLKNSKQASTDDELENMVRDVVEGKADADAETETEEDSGSSPKTADSVKNAVGGGAALFPRITNVTIQTTDEVSAKSCSTGLTTRLLPFKNKNGEIEWAFTDDSTMQGSELDVFKIKQESKETPVTDKKDDKNDLTPTTSNSSHSDSILSNPGDHDKQDDSTPLTNSPYSDEEDSKGLNGGESGCEDMKGGESGDGESGSEIYQCPHCDVNFKIRGYLTRHLKKHAVKKAYSCPFYKYSIYVDENNLTHKCHPNGGFSRRDTYKTHLKSRHFKYPKGVKTKERNSSPGFCSMCNEPFPNSEIWCEIHVEGGECIHLPKGFTGKSRIKNKIRKEQQRKDKENGHSGNMSNGSLASPSKTPSTYDTPQSYSYYNVPTMISSNSPSFSPNSEVITQGNFINTPTSIPYQVSPGTLNSLSITHHILNQNQMQLSMQQSMQQQQQMPPQVPVQQQIQMQSFQQYQEPLQLQQIQQQQQQRIQQVQQQQQQIQQYQQPQQLVPQAQYQQLPYSGNEFGLPQFQQFSSHTGLKQVIQEDYDDEYCLDLDQLPIMADVKAIYN